MFEMDPLSLDRQHPADVPGGAPVVPAGSYGAGALGDYFQDEFDNAYPFLSADCDATDFSCTKTCGDTFMPDPVLSNESWLDESGELSSIIHQIESNPSSQEGSPVGSWDGQSTVKSPMEILEEIREEAAHFVPDVVRARSLDPPVWNCATGFDQQPTSLPSSPADLATLQPMEVEEPKSGAQASPAAAQRELTRCEVENLLQAQLPFLDAPSPGPSVVRLQVVQVVGDQLLLPDGTKAVILRGGQSPAGPSGSGPEVRKKRAYQKGGYERKKMQNRESSFRYRVKKKEEKGRLVQEYVQQAERNKQLKAKAEDLGREIEYWKKFIADMRK